MTDPAELLAECDARGVRLVPTGGMGLTIDGLASSVTPDLIARLKSAKLELLALLCPADDPTKPAPAMPVCRCGSTRWRDVPIHDGQSLRRDCERCRRFIGFAVWYGRILDKGDSSAYNLNMRKRTMKLTEQLRQAIDDSGLTRYRIAKETGISEATLSKFYLGQRGLSMEAMDALGECLDLTIISRRKPAKKEK